MKKILLAFSLALLFSISAKAQNYTFSHTTGTYANLTGATSLNNNTTWDDDVFQMSLPFPFTFNGISYTSMFVETNGFVYFISPTGDASAIAAYGADLMDLDTVNSASPISYQVTGTSGNRILKIEWRNAGFYNSNFFGISDFINVQLWLYEGSNNIEVHIGPNTIADPTIAFDSPTAGPAIGLLTEIDINDNITGRFLTGSPASPTFTTITAQPDYAYLTGVPANGQIYRFSTTGTGTGVAETRELAQLSFFPNPVKDKLQINGLQHVNGKNLEVNIYDLNGRKVSAVVVSETTPAIDLSTLAKGMYVAEIINGSSRSTTKLIKQ